MTRVLLVAATTGYQIRSFGSAAEALGVRLMIASDRCDRLEDPWWDQAIPVRFHDEGGAVAAIEAACADARPDAVIAVGDRPAILAAHISRALGLSGNPPAAAEASRNKRLARLAFRAAGLPTPDVHELAASDDPASLAGDVRYPAVVKPLALSGSRGVIRVNDPAELVEAVSRLRRLLQSPDVRLERDAVHEQILVESFIPGREFAIEGVLTRGVFQPFAIFDKPDPLDGPFFEETIYVTPSRQPAATQQRIVDGVARAARALGLRHGPVHAECRVNDDVTDDVTDDRVFVLEVAPRPIGGLCSKVLRFVRPGGGHDSPAASLEEVLLRQALGEDVSGYTREAAAAGVMMLPIPKRGVFRGCEGVDAARAVAGVDDVIVTAKAGGVIVPLPEGRSYLGFIFAHAADAAGVEQALRTAHGRLRFLIEKEIALI